MAALLACARLRLQPEDSARLRAALGRDIDWSRLLTLAHAHGLMPLLHHHVAAGDVPLPAASLPALRAQAKANAHRALRLSGALLETLDVCTAEGIPVVPLKGPVLAQQLYGTVALRQSRDLDLLIRDADVPRLVRLLQQRGYRLEHRDGPELDALTRRDLHHVSVTHPERRVRIEIHYWLLRPRGRRAHGIADITARLRPMAFFGRQIRILDGADLLVYLCEHGAEHAWCRLEWLAGVGELRRRVDAPSAAASPFARELGTTRRIDAAMDLADRLLDADAESPGESSGRRAFAANRFVMRRLHREPARVVESSAERFFYALFTDASAAAVTRRVRTMLLAPGVGESTAFPLPRALTPLHWVLRPFRLVARQLRRPLRRRPALRPRPWSES